MACLRFAFAVLVLWVVCPPPLSAQSEPLAAPSAPISPSPVQPSTDVQRVAFGVSVPARTAARMKELEGHLVALAELSENRVLEGALQIVAGAAFAGIGAVLVDDSFLRSVLFLSGSITALRGASEIIFVPDAAIAARAFVDAPALTANDVRARIALGERELTGLARRFRRARFADAGLTFLGAALYVPAYWAIKRLDSPGYRFGDDSLDYVGLSFTGIGLAAAIVTLCIRSEAEVRAESYSKLKRRFERERPHELEQLSMRPSVRFSLSGHEARASVRLRF